MENSRELPVVEAAEVDPLSTLRLWPGDRVEATLVVTPKPRWQKLLQWFVFQDVKATIKVDCVAIKIEDGHPTVDIRITTSSIEAVLTRG